MEIRLATKEEHEIVKNFELNEINANLKKSFKKYQRKLYEK